MKKPLVLMILDGYGLRDETYGNAIKAAKTPRMEELLSQYPHTQIGASGLNVGLPEGQMGNSEVGHTNIGAGRLVYQDLTRISKAIVDGDFFENPTLLDGMKEAKKKGTALHLLGLLSPGGVHSHNTHLYALLEMAKKQEIENVFVHCFLDGRDVPPESGADDVLELQEKIKEIGVGKIATVTGRYYAMDRDNRWERVQQAYNAMVFGQGTKNSNPAEAVRASYEEGITDEFVHPIVCLEDSTIQSGDSVIFYNFRPDRAREITRALVDPKFDGFQPVEPLDLTYVTMTEYDATMPRVQVAFPPEILTHTMGELLSQQGMTQLRIAETEKYPHVTFFFNGGMERVYPGEDRALIPSPKVATYDLQPEMSAYLVTEELLRRLDSGKYDVVILNFANCDMVGHTGDFHAAVKAVETVDECMGNIVDRVLALGGALLITADHGNAEKMYEPDGSPFTAHTTNPVPLIAVGLGEVQLVEKNVGKLSDLAPTMLHILGLDQPEEMTGKNLIL